MLNAGVEFVAAREVEGSHRRIEVMTDHRYILENRTRQKVYGNIECEE